MRYMVAQNEMLHSGSDEVTEGFEVLPLAVEVLSVVVQKRAGRNKVKGGPGRPRLYNGTDRRIIAGMLKKHGLTGGIKHLETERQMKISLTTARSVAEEFEIVFARGRPAA